MASTQHCVRERAVEAATAAARAAELRRLLDSHNDAYYRRDAPTVSDAEYDALRRRKKQQPLDEELNDSFDDQLAAEVEQRFVAAGITIDPADVLDVLDQWKQSSDEHLQKLAILMRHKYVSDMTVQQIAEDLKTPLTTVYRWHTEALHKLRDTFSNS